MTVVMNIIECQQEQKESALVECLATGSFVGGKI